MRYNIRVAFRCGESNILDSTIQTRPYLLVIPNKIRRQWSVGHLHLMHAPTSNPSVLPENSPLRYLEGWQIREITVSKKYSVLQLQSATNNSNSPTVTCRSMIQTVTSHGANHQPWSRRSFAGWTRDGMCAAWRSRKNFCPEALRSAPWNIEPKGQNKTTRVT